MARRRATSKRHVGGVASPTDGFPCFRQVLCFCLLLLPLGMVFLFGGTRLWAAGPFWLPLLTGLGVLFGFTFVLAGHEGKTLSLPRDFFFWSAALLYVAVRAAFFSAVPYESWKELAFLFTAWLLYGAMCDLGNQACAWSLGSILLLSALLIQSVWAINLHWHDSRMVLWIPRPEQYEMRASGTFICPNHYAHFLQMGMIVALGLVLTPKIRLSLRIYAAYVLIPSGIALLLTHSRSGMIGAFAGFSMLFLGKALRGGLRKGLWVLAGLGTAAAALVFGLIRFYPPMRERMLRDISNNIRISQVWPDTWAMIKGEGIWGSGPGTYANVFDRYREHFSSSSLYLEYAHNEFLNTLAEYGWPASLAMLGLLIWMCVRWGRDMLRARSDQAAMIPVMLLALTAGTFAHAVFDFNLHIPSNGLLFVALVGWLSGQGLYRHALKEKPLPVPRVRVYAGCGVLACMILLPFVVRLSMGSWHEKQMVQAEKAADMERAFQHAASMRSWNPWYARGWTQLGLQYRRQAFWLQDKQEKTAVIQLSREAYLQALERNRYAKVALAGLVELARLEERPEEALRLIMELRDITPFDRRVRIQQGLILRELNRPAEALEVFLQARELQGPRSRQIELNIRRLRQQVGEDT